MIESGAAGVHYEDQLAAEKKCGHLGGKVLVPTGQFLRTLSAARLAADVAGVPTLARRPHRRRRRDAADERRRRARRARSSPASGRPKASSASAAGSRRRSPAASPTPLRRHGLDGDVDARSRRGAGVRRGDPRAVPGQAARLQLLPVVQLARHLDDETIATVPAGARRARATGSSSSPWPASTRSTRRCSSWRAGTPSAG